MTHKPLEGQVALVTGVSRGIGRASAMTLAKAGANIVSVARGSNSNQTNAIDLLADDLGHSYAEVVGVRGDVGADGTAGEAVEAAATASRRNNV